MTERAVILPGSEVVMHYTLRLEDGTVADTSVDGEPLRFSLGDGTMIAGLEHALLGLGAGDTERILIDPRDGFGARDPASIHGLPRSAFPEDLAVAEGAVVGFTLPSGEEIPGLVVGISATTVQVDFNHPLAGHTLTFEVEILAVNPSPAL